MLKIFITLKAWQVVVLVLIVCGIVGGFYAAYGRASISVASSSLPANSRLVRVQYGNLTNSVSASGGLVLPNKEELTFGGAGTVQEVNVEVGDTVKKGDVMAKLDNVSILSLQESVTSAKIALRDTQDALQNAQTQGISDAQRAVVEAQQQLSNAQTQAPLNIANAQYAVDNASQNYNDSLARFMSGSITAQELENASTQLDTANLNLEIAKQDADKAVADAQDNLAAAEQALANTGPGSLDLELKQQQVASAQAVLDEALASLGNATLAAPFNGIVSEVNIQAGQTVSAGTVAIEITDPSDVEVSATVDEIDVPQVQVGQKVAVSLDALPNDTFSGKVSAISIIGSSQSGVVSYPVTINLTVPSGVQLRQGMSATATITTQEVDNVLLVPVAAISGSSTNNPRVTVMVNGVPEVRTVKVGQSNDQYTEIVSGLNAGDEVVVTSSTSTSSSNSSSSSRGGFGIGSFGGGGIISITTGR
jgi:RND family efflux transporter MFP subunit